MSPDMLLVQQDFIHVRCLAHIKPSVCAGGYDVLEMRPVTSTSYADSLKQEIEPVKTARQKHINYCCKSLKGFSDGSLLVSKTKFFF